MVSVIDEALSANRAATVMAFQFGELANESGACEIASHRANFSVYARDGAIINCVSALWEPADTPHHAWAPIRASYWRPEATGQKPSFCLGNFGEFSRYIAMTRAEQVPTPEPEPTEVKVK